jgi:hypothetical protein
MKEYSQIQKFCSALMIFILLPYLSGCTSTRLIQKSDLPRPDPGKYAYIIHGEKIKFLLEKSTISKDTLSGKILQTYFDNAYDAGNKIHYGYHANDNGLISVIFGKFDTYEDFKRNYFGTFLLEMYAFKINILLSEEQDNTLKGLSDFISKFANDYFKTYVEISKKLKFDGCNSFKIIRTTI